MPAITLVDRITAVVQSAPAWLRTDLSSRDAAVRLRAEETMAAMIASALTYDPATVPADSAQLT